MQQLYIKHCPKFYAHHQQRLKDSHGPLSGHVFSKANFVNYHVSVILLSTEFSPLYISKYRYIKLSR